MSKMNFAYNPAQDSSKPEIRPHLLHIGYLVLAVAVAWMIAKPYLLG